MENREIDLKPITHITTDAIGEPGMRVFYVQAQSEDETTTVLVEKIQIQTLAIGVEQFLTELTERFPDLPVAESDYDESDMHIQPPVDPLFRAGELGLAYEQEGDFLILVARENLSEDIPLEESRLIRFWCSRTQLRTMCRWGMEVVGKGRKTCPLCGEAMESEEHFCVKKNGHKNK
ncbi:MAG: DUF3090 family protein [Anaerolineaceae bacterium]|nr:DUF3090 family protein [Anaerolineaceae bacterium]